MDVRRTAIAAVAALAFVVACTADKGPRSDEPEVAGTQATSTLDSVAGPVVVAVGDIACPPGSDRGPTTCEHSRTAELARGYEPRRILGLGDQQYDSGELSEYRGSYARSWGSLKPIVKPVPGNHEYRTPRASGYYRYFRNQQPGAPGYYAFDVGSWRVHALNTNCSVVDCVRQDRWLERSMARHPRRCSAITMHHPRFSSGKHGSNRFVQRFWRTAMEHRTDIALAGHDHDYERFRPMNAAGGRSRTGITSFVSGAGGRGLYPWRGRVAGSVARHNRDSGVLALRLGNGRYAWEYKTTTGVVVDSGTRRCH